MATPSSTLAWTVPWMEEPGRMQSIESLSWTRLKQLSSSSMTQGTSSDMRNTLWFMWFSHLVVSDPL